MMEQPQRTSKPVLEIRHLVKYFGEREILKDIDITVYQDDVICVIGASGSGKSTLLRCINLLEEPTSGEIIHRGKNILDGTTPLTRHRAQVGMVFQQFNLFNNMTVLENCMVGPVKVLGKDKAAARAAALKYLAKVGMSAYANARPHQISGGQRQRVAIARALALEPQILLFDEPTSALDPQMVGEVLTVMRELAKEGLTMIIVTHEIAFARDVASRIVFVDNGVIAEDDAPDVIFNRPKNERTREFLARFTGGA